MCNTEKRAMISSQKNSVKLGLGIVYPLSTVVKITNICFDEIQKKLLQDSPLIFKKTAPVHDLQRII